MHPLHGCNHTKIGKAPYIIRVYMLCVFNPPPHLSTTPLREGPFIDIKHFSVRAVSNSMRIELKAMFCGNLSCCLNIVRLFNPEARAARHIFVRFQQPCSMRSKCPINLALDRSDGQMVSPIADHSIRGEDVIHRYIGFGTNHNV